MRRNRDREARQRWLICGRLLALGACICTLLSPIRFPSCLALPFRTLPTPPYPTLRLPNRISSCLTLLPCPPASFSRLSRVPVLCLFVAPCDEYRRRELQGCISCKTVTLPSVPLVLRGSEQRR